MGYKNFKFKFLGITLFKFIRKKRGMRFYFFGIPLFYCNRKFRKFYKKFSLNKNFDTRSFDKEIASWFFKRNQKKLSLNSKRIAFFATELYDMGGHTKCVKDLLSSFQGLYETKLFLVNYDQTMEQAPKAMNEIGQMTSVVLFENNSIRFLKNVEQFAQKIIDFSPKALMVYIHPDDVFGAAVLSLIHRTNIKIIFHNHASHYPLLGISFSDVIMEGMPSCVKITQEKRHLMNTVNVGIQSLKKDQIIYYSISQLDKLKTELGVPEGHFLTMSGGSPYKFFDQEGSEYFELIKDLLQKEKNLTHVIISEFDSKQKETINGIFEKSPDLLKRIVFLPFQTSFDKFFQSADVFIDSFPVSSALTQIDLMRNKVASVVKINKKNPEFSFHEYQMSGYPYMYENVKDMEQGILYLLHHPQKRQEIIDKNYDFWLNTYESHVFRDKVIQLLEN